jgi:hypothetical protein
LVGNGTTSILQSANLAWNNTSNTLSVSNLQMAGQITGVTTLSGTTGLFGTVSTTNNTNVAIPSVGVAGGTGDKLILRAGTASICPYSLGINNSTLWYSVPSGASHKFYNNGVNTLTIDSTGNIYANSGLISINAADWSSGRTKGIIFRSGYDTPNNNNYNCSILTCDHDANGFCDGLSINGFDGISFCTGSNTRQPRMTITKEGNASCTGNLNIGNTIASFNSSAISLNKNTIVGGDLKVGYGLANIHNGSLYAVIANFMASGSLTIGGTNANYGTGVNQWSSNTAGLMMECADHTEICVHDAGTRVASLMYYDGVNNKIHIGRNKVSWWGSISSVVVPNITLGTAGKINSVDDYHYIQIDQSTDTLTIQEYGTISFNIGPSKTQRAYVSSVGMFVSGSLGVNTYPSYPLQVNGGSFGGFTNVFVRTGYYGGQDFNYTGSYSAFFTAAFNNALYVGGLTINASDIRIKKDVNDIDDDGALQKILKIQPKTYKYIDVLTRGDSVIYGFIAQQIKEVIPEAVSGYPAKLEAFKTLPAKLKRRSSPGSPTFWVIPSGLYG